MTIISVHAEHEYSVEITPNYVARIQQIAGDRSRAAVIFSESMRSQIPDLQLGDCEVLYFPIPDGESAKNFDTTEKLWNWLGAAGFTRSDLVVAIGGGTITDVSGFIAATWLRGVDWVAVPTTVAGMVDAAVGGKTGINSDYGKNLIGAFHSPLAVLIDFSWLPTLSDRDFAAGLAEVVKCGFIQDPEILNLLDEKTLHDVRNDVDLVTELVKRAVTVKAKVVSEDFTESFAREALNYGHTFGHAVEIASNYSLRHGEAVSIGMMYVAELSHAQELIDSHTRDLHARILNGLGLPTTLKEGEWQRLLASMKLDKKSRGNTLRFVVLNGIGKTQRLQDVDEEILYAAYERVLS